MYVRTPKKLMSDLTQLSTDSLRSDVGTKTEEMMHASNAARPR